MNRHRVSFFMVLVVFAGMITACRRPDVPANPQEMKEKLAKKLNWALWKVDSTDKQDREFDRLLDGLAPDLFAFQQESRGIKLQLIKTLGADIVDPRAMESIQKKGVDLFDRYTKRMTRAGMDSARILTMKQRKELVQFWKEWEFGK